MAASKVLLHGVLDVYVERAEHLPRTYKTAVRGRALSAVGGNRRDRCSMLPSQRAAAARPPACTLPSRACSSGASDTACAAAAVTYNACRRRCSHPLHPTHTFRPKFPPPGLQLCPAPPLRLQLPVALPHFPTSNLTHPLSPSRPPAASKSSCAAAWGPHFMAAWTLTQCWR